MIFFFGSEAHLCRSLKGSGSFCNFALEGWGSGLMGPGYFVFSWVVLRAVMGKTYPHMVLIEKLFHTTNNFAKCCH